MAYMKSGPEIGKIKAELTQPKKSVSKKVPVTAVDMSVDISKKKQMPQTTTDNISLSRKNRAARSKLD